MADSGGGPGRVVASFTSSDPTARPSDFTATIDWGDGNTSGGTITPDGRGGFNVSGSNLYAAPGTYTITVTITDRFHSTATAQSTAEVGAPGPAPAPGGGGGGGAAWWPAFAAVTAPAEVPQPVVRTPGAGTSVSALVAAPDWKQGPSPLALPGQRDPDGADMGFADAVDIVLREAVGSLLDGALVDDLVRARLD